MTLANNYILREITAMIYGLSCKLTFVQPVIPCFCVTENFILFSKAYHHHHHHFWDNLGRGHTVMNVGLMMA